MQSSSGSRKRKRPDEDEELHCKLPFEKFSTSNINNCVDDDDDDDEDDEEIGVLKKSDHDKIANAQEPATLSQYDGIKITPFNLEEENEEGRFDKAGNFIFEKDDTKDEEHDTWAESIDWEAVERQEREKKDKLDDIKTRKDDNVEKETPKRSRLDCYREMLRIMRPDETVQRSIRRLGSEVPKKKTSSKKSSSNDQPSETVEVVEIRRKLNLMIDLAHQILEEGDMDIYQKSYEQLEEAIN